MKAKAFIYLVILAVPIVACAQQAAVDIADVAFNELAQVETFAFGPVDYAGITSLGERDFRVLLADPSAITRFEKLYAVGNVQAKSYALVGLHKLAPNKFKQLISSAEISKMDVVTQNGCIVMHAPFSRVIEAIAAGKYPPL